MLLLARHRQVCEYPRCSSAQHSSPSSCSILPCHPSCRHRWAGGSLGTPSCDTPRLGLAPCRAMGCAERAPDPAHGPDPLPLSVLHSPNQAETVWKSLCRISGELCRLRSLSVRLSLPRVAVLCAAGTGHTLWPCNLQLLLLTVNSNSSGTKKLINTLKPKAYSNVKPKLLHQPQQPSSSSGNTRNMYSGTMKCLQSC